MLVHCARHPDLDFSLTVLVYYQANTPSGSLVVVWCISTLIHWDIFFFVYMVLRARIGVQLIDYQ